MEGLEYLPKIKIIGTKPSELELKVGDVVEMAEISVTGEARVRGFEKDGESYKSLFELPISMHDSGKGNSKNKPKKFQIYVYGITDEGNKQSIVYHQSANPETNEPNIVRLTPLEQITKYRGLTYQD